MHNPILIDVTPPEGYTLAVTADTGGLAGLTITGQSGPAVTLTLSVDGGVSWQPLSYPHTLAAGEILRLKRTDASFALSTINASFVDTPAGFTVGRDGDGYLTSSAVTRAADGYLTTAAPLARDADGYLTGATA